MLASRAAIDFTEFEPGDYVVHLEHGIGRYVGLESLPGDGGGEALLLNMRATPGSTCRSTRRGKSHAMWASEKDTPNFRSSGTAVGRGRGKERRSRFSIMPRA